MSKRLNLREFQQGLIDRIQSTDMSGARVSTLGVQIAGQNWLVEMGDIAEVLPLPPLTPVPFTKPWFRGVANVRGNLYSVIDMAAYEHSGAASGDTNNRVLLVAGRYAVNAALLVDCVLGLRDARSWRQSEGIDKQTEYHDEFDTSWRKLDVHGLVEQAEFMQIGN
ncbi:MAG: chemotaxis protein CheW [Nitrosomonadales bacterium]|nr:chemotaxis protein CheW [Nitrosomonadales bacterium]